MRSFAFHSQRIIKLRLVFYLSIVSYCGCAQTERIHKFDDFLNKQGSEANSAMLRHCMQQVDSLSHTTGIANHFARIYTASMKNIGVQLTGMDSGAQNFIKKFEISFIGYFLDAAFEFEKSGHLSPGSIWHPYFTHPNAESWQLTLIGINAHVNGDIWKSLVDNFPEVEIRRYKKKLMSFHASIAKAFQPMFHDLLMQSSYLRFINDFTKGSAKLYGEWLIYNWRLRQVNLAILYYQDQEKFRKRLKIIDRKRYKIDRTILSKGKADRPVYTFEDSSK